MFFFTLKWKLENLPKTWSSNEICLSFFSFQNNNIITWPRFYLCFINFNFKFAFLLMSITQLTHWVQIFKRITQYTTSILLDAFFSLYLKLYEIWKLIKSEFKPLFRPSIFYKPKQVSACRKKERYQEMIVYEFRAELYYLCIYFFPSENMNYKDAIKVH